METFAYPSLLIQLYTLFMLILLCFPVSPLFSCLVFHAGVRTFRSIMSLEKRGKNNKSPKKKGKRVGVHRVSKQCMYIYIHCTYVHNIWYAWIIYNVFINTVIHKIMKKKLLSSSPHLSSQLHKQSRPTQRNWCRRGNRPHGFRVIQHGGWRARWPYWHF